jgi:hypothetical protein
VAGGQHDRSAAVDRVVVGPPEERYWGWPRTDPQNRTGRTRDTAKTRQAASKTERMPWEKDQDYGIEAAVCLGV